MVRNAMGDPAKTIYYTSALIRDILVENEGKGIKFIHGGVRMFMKQDVQGEGVCRWRIQSEGMPILEGYVGEERIVRLYRRETLRKLLIEMFPKVDDGAWKNLGEIGERVRDISMGCCVLRIEPSDQEGGFSERMVLPLWRSLHSLNLMLAKEDRTAMLLRIFNDATPLVNNHNPTKRAGRIADSANPEVAAGFKMEDEEVKVDVNLHAVEGNGPVEETDMHVMIKPGPYGDIIGAKDTVGLKDKDVKAGMVEKDEDIGGPEIQLNGTGGVEGQVDTIS
jgi:multisite-specific tRNA:(cytosine-C5)-methyltransferase